MYFQNFEENCCGLICQIDKSSIIPVPLKNVRLNIKVVDFVTQVEIYQEYVNSESNSIEVLYSYPVEESATIIGK